MSASPGDLVLFPGGDGLTLGLVLEADGDVLRVSPSTATFRTLWNPKERKGVEFPASHARAVFAASPAVVPVPEPISEAEGVM